VTAWGGSKEDAIGQVPFAMRAAGEVGGGIPERPESRQRDGKGLSTSGRNIMPFIIEIDS